jgi:hypothetical protein
MLALLALSALAAAPTPAPAPCRAESLALRTDAADGDFNGMSHGGTWLVVRNTGSTTCLLPGLPTVLFLDAKGQSLPIERKAPPGMHPGPVVIPVALKPGREASTPLRWISGEVYDGSRCFTPTRVRMRFGAKALLEAPVTARVCAPPNAPAGIDQPPMTLKK